MKAILETLKHKWAQYLLEIIVIILGILGALALDNWNEDRKDRDREKQLLIDLKNDLEKNITEYDRLKQTREGQIRALEEIITLYAEPKRLLKNSYLDSLIETARVPTTFDAPMGVINSIISNGDINLINNKEIKNFVTSYDGLLQNANKTNATLIDIWENRLNRDLDKYVNWNYLINQVRKKVQAVPIKQTRFKRNYKGFFNDPIIENILTQSLFIVSIINKEELDNSKTVNDISNKIDEELKRWD